MAATAILTVPHMHPSGGTPEAQALLRLLQLASPSLPVGAYSYSEGLEYAVHAGAVRDAATLRAWIEDGLEFGAARLEAAVLARVHDAWRQDDLERVQSWDRWLGATREGEELRHQSLDMGRALLRLLKDLDPPLPNVSALFAAPCNFASVFGIAAAYWDIPRRAAVAAYLQSWVANLAGAGVKLIPLGQTAGQQLLWDLQAGVAQAAQTAAHIADEDLGVGNWGLALAGMAHETQYSRLFRS
jgi:urease accessory protein